jgi:ribosome-associated translation inhibitor RaiA
VFSRTRIEKGTAMAVEIHDVTVQLTVRGDISEEDRSYAVRKIERALQKAQAPVLKAHLVLGWESEPAHPNSARLEIGLDLNGVPVRAHVAADGIREGADLLQDRLGHRLVQLQDRAQSRHRWTKQRRAFGRVGAERSRPRAHGRDTSEPPAVVRRKTFAAHPLTVEEAAYEMDLLDHDFYLYTDQRSGSDALIHHTAYGENFAVLLTPAVLSADQAREHLDLAGEPFVFYRESDDSSAQVLYRRFGGGYGLITSL